MTTIPEAEERNVAALVGYLAERDVPCPLCSYNLRGLRAESCPECNHRLTLRVGLVEMAQGAYIATLIALSIGTGASLLLFAGVVIFSIVDNRWPNFPDEVFCLIIFPIAAGLLLGLALMTLGRQRGRRRFARFSKGTRQRLAGGAWVLILGGFATWMWLATRL